MFQIKGRPFRGELVGTVNLNTGRALNLFDPDGKGITLAADERVVILQASFSAAAAGVVELFDDLMGDFRSGETRDIRSVVASRLRGRRREIAGLDVVSQFHTQEGSC